MTADDVYALVSPYFRGRRLRRFFGRFNVTENTHVLDVGGCSNYWRQHPIHPRVTVVNLPDYRPPAEGNGFLLVYGDGTKLPFRDNSFEIAHSNSVLEHLGTWDRQVAFSRELRRVAKRIWVQAPAKGFPLECHTFDLVWHWFGPRVQEKCLRNYSPWGWLNRPSEKQVREFLETTRLVSEEEMQQLFPGCEILRETVAGLTKSLIAASV